MISQVLTVENIPPARLFNQAGIWGVMSDEQNLDEEREELRERIRGAAIRWEVHSKTVAGWLEIGAEVGEGPPVFGGDPDLFLEWYRVHVGREASVRIKTRAGELRRELGMVEEPEAEVDLGPVELIERALQRLGLSLTLARVIEEEERAHANYRAKMEAGKNADAERKRWRDAGEMKRSLQKNEECVEVAFELLRDWVRKDWEPNQREIRKRLEGSEIGRGARSELMECKTEKEWERVWDRWICKALEK
jgi:hypothetical protein